MKRRNLVIILTFAILIYGALTSLIVFIPDKFVPNEADTIIVLGHSMNDDLTPSAWLVKRLETALELYNNDYSSNIIVTGGKGSNDEIPVANSMATWLIESGVPRDSIYLETEANNTYENFKYSKDICNNLEFDSALVVTNDFHIFRSYIIGSEWFDEIYLHSEYLDFSISKLIAYMRETMAIVKYFIMDFPKSFF